MKNNKDIFKNTVKQCPMFYSDVNLPETETCACWGWEFDEGWYEIAKEMSYEIELINRQFYPKYRTKIVMDQMKEKYGELTVYWSVHVDPGKIGTAFNAFFNRLYLSLMRVDYALKRVVDVPRHDEVDEELIDKAVYDKGRKNKYNPVNVKYVKRNGSYYRVTTYDIMDRAHYEPTKHKLLYRLKRVFGKLRFLFSSKQCKDSDMIMMHLHSAAEKIIDEATSKAHKTCEHCGSQIGCSWSPTCVMRGWIKYVCDSCAKKSEREYTIEGKTGVYVSGKLIKNKKSK